MVRGPSIAVTDLVAPEAECAPPGVGWVRHARGARHSVFLRGKSLPDKRILASRSIIYSLRLLQVRHEQAVGHALLKVPDHRRLAWRDRDYQRLARSRSELDDICPIAPSAEDRAVIVASHTRRLVLCNSSTASGFVAGACSLL